ncbi:hypothetical protein [Francisella uliginis]|uniref:hypothetical protein n=1 Tax=Francisella uliginis TaxID=573570 RepID=UPI000A885E4E|nr:hypothetical protein [Francisella uliginis]
MTIQISNRVKNIKPSATVLMSSKVQELVDKGEKILSLSVGEPGFSTPDIIKKQVLQQSKIIILNIQLLMVIEI